MSMHDVLNWVAVWRVKDRKLFGAEREKGKWMDEGVGGKREVVESCGSG